jgi:hypothetical protein
MMPTPEELTGRVLARLAQQPVPPLSDTPPAEPLATALAAILSQARATFSAIGAELGPGSLDDRNHYDYLAQNLAKIAGFQSFSLAEYVYHLGDGRNPGVRLWLEERRWQRRVEVLLFPEVGRWQVDAAGRKVTRLLLTLWPQGEAVRPEPGPGLGGRYPAGEAWPAALVRALCLPVLPLT